MSRDVCKLPLLVRRREMSVVCDDCRFIGTKESRLRVRGRGLSTAKLQLQNPNVNTLRTSELANKMGGSFAKNGTIDYLCWAKRKIFLLASRNVSNCK